MLLASNSVRRARPLLGTFVEIAAAGAKPGDMRTGIAVAFDVIAQVHGLMSFHEATSDVARLNREAWARPVGVHPWTYRVVEAGLDIYRRSAGAFDIAVAPVLQDLKLLPRWDHARSSGGGAKHSSGRSTSAAIELLSDCRIRFHNAGVCVDLGGIAKGFAVDCAVNALKEHGVPSGAVNAGGDLAVFGVDSETVSIRDPRNPARMMLGLKIADRALASSGRRFDPLRCLHPTAMATIDPRTRSAAKMVVGATVVAPSCMTADALTKAVMLDGSSAGGLLEQYRASAIMVLAGGGVRMTEDLCDAVCLAA